MPILYIPTRNRPVSLSKLLHYLIRFYPRTKVVVADAGKEHYKHQNQSNIDLISKKLDVQHIPYPTNTGYVERALDVLDSVSEEYVIFGADDEYPNMDLLLEGEIFLRNNPDYVTAMGSRIALLMGKDEQIRTKIKEARPIQGEEAWRRMKSYSEWSFATTYAITRRDHILRRLKRLQDLAPAGFYDFIVGLHDAFCGKIKSFPDIGFFTTRTYIHDFFRPTNKLFFLQNSEEVLSIYDIIKEDLLAENILSFEKADNLSQIIVRNRIAEITGRDFSKLAEFKESTHFNNPVVQKQHALFEEIFIENTKAYTKYADHLSYIFNALEEVTQSGGKLQGKNYNTLDGQV